MSFKDRLSHAWNAFMNKDPTRTTKDYSYGSYYYPDRPIIPRGNERSTITAVFNKIAMDVASMDIRHVQLDDDDRYSADIDSHLNECLTLEANLDQTARSFRQDVALSLLDEGYIAIVPTDTVSVPSLTGAFDILSMRVGKILEWHPDWVRVEVYNEKTGKKEDINCPKRTIAIVESPLYSVVNEPNSTMQRLIRKFNLLDVVDERCSSRKLDLIIQLPYVIKTEARRQQAEMRRKEIEEQLAGSTYGIAYTDGTERITQLNRPVESNLMAQIEYLTSMLLSQLGITQGILDGTADDKTMANYYTRTVEPIISAIVDEMKRKFVTKTARTQHKTVMYFRNPLKLVPTSQIADMGDKLTRNKIVTANEMRQVIGLKPSDSPDADKLVNANISQPNPDNSEKENPEGGNQNGEV